MTKVNVITSEDTQQKWNAYVIILLFICFSFCFRFLVSIFVRHVELFFDGTLWKLFHYLTVFLEILENFEVGYSFPKIFRYINSKKKIEKIMSSFNDFSTSIAKFTFGINSYAISWKKIFRSHFLPKRKYILCSIIPLPKKTRNNIYAGWKNSNCLCCTIFEGCKYFAYEYFSFPLIHATLQSLLPSHPSTVKVTLEGPFRCLLKQKNSYFHTD